MTINIVVDFDVAPDHVDSATAAFLNLAGRTRTEPGALRFDVFSDPATPHRVVLVEEWADQDAIDEHMQKSYTKDFVASVDGMFTAPQTVRRLTPL